MQHINVELKAQCTNHDKVRSFLRAEKAAFKGVDHQIDTYFNVHSGRLKLRQGSIENSLIFYSRQDQAGPKRADVILADIPVENQIRAVLESSLGILVQVDKLREIYFIDNVKFHIDRVKQLGDFVEIEAINYNGTPQERLLDKCNYYKEVLGIPDEQLIAISYSDMLLSQQRNSRIVE